MKATLGTLATVAIMTMLALPIQAQKPRKAELLTEAQVSAALKRDPTLATGFKTSKGYSAKVTKPIRNGVALQYSGPSLSGTMNLTGPLSPNVEKRPLRNV